MPTAPLVSVVYHSGYGHTAMVAQSVARGAAKHGESMLLAIDPAGQLPDGGWDTLLRSDAIVFGAPTYMGSASAPFKIFVDNTSKIWFSRAWKDKLAGGFTNSGAPCGDKLGTLTQILLFAAQHGMIWVGSADVPGGEDGINRLGSSLGVMTYSKNAPPTVTPPANDLATAEAYGERMSLSAARWALRLPA